MFCNRKLYPFKVHMHLDGRHPYLESNKLDMETQDIVVTVTARDWAHAEKVALYLDNLPRAWSRQVTGIHRA